MLLVWGSLPLFVISYLDVMVSDLCVYTHIHNIYFYKKTNWLVYNSIRLTGHPFTNGKRIIWMHLIRAFLWSIWTECNNRFFNDKGSTFDRFFDHIIFLAMTWCKCTTSYSSYSLSSLLTNWRDLL